MNKLMFISIIFFTTLLSPVRGDRTTDRLDSYPPETQMQQSEEEEYTLERGEPYFRRQNFLCHQGDTRCIYEPTPRDVDRSGNRSMNDLRD